MPQKMPQSVQKRWASSEQKIESGFGSFIRNDYLCTRWWVINGCWLSVRCSLMHFIVECGIEYGCQFVTQFFLNPPDCLYTKKSWEILQSYEESRAKQKKLFFFLPRRSNFATFIAKLRKVGRNAKRNKFLFSVSPIYNNVYALSEGNSDEKSVKNTLIFFVFT